MANFRILSGTWYDIEAPNKEIAQEAYDAYWGSDDMPDQCKVIEGEVDSIWEDELSESEEQ